MKQYELFVDTETTNLASDPPSNIDRMVGYLPTLDSTEKQLTLEYVQRRLSAFLLEGSDCPCCGQHVKMRSESLTRTVVEPLIWMAENFCVIDWSGRTPILVEARWVSVSKSAPREFRTSRHYTRAKYWGLIEQSIEDSVEEQLTSGLWRLTQKGLEFISGNISLPKKAHVYLKVERGYDGDRIHVNDALNCEFSLREQLRRR